MAAEYSLRRADGRPLGSFAEAQALIRREFPGAEFCRTESGADPIRRTEERGGEVTPDLRESLEGMPAGLEGFADGSGFSVTLSSNRHAVRSAPSPAAARNAAAQAPTVARS